MQHDATIELLTEGGDKVSTYFGMREFHLGDAHVPATDPLFHKTDFMNRIRMKKEWNPPTGPQNGIDRPGSDMPGSPFKLSAADPNLCWNPELFYT